MAAEKGSIQSVDKAVDLLDAMLSSRKPLSLKELSAITGFPKSTAHAFLNTMRNRHLLDQDEDGNYYFGIRVFEYGTAASLNTRFKFNLKPYLERLAQATGGTAYLSILDNHYVITFDYHKSDSEFSCNINLGERMPIHATSEGKVFLAYMENRDAEKLLKAIDETGFQVFTSKTIANTEDLLESLRDVKKNGYAVNQGEYKKEIISVSAPILDKEGKVQFVIGCAGSFRWNALNEFLNIVNNVKYYAEEITKLSNKKG